VLLFSMKDEERDTRDAILLLRALCDKAAAAGLNIVPLLDEVAALSSPLDRYGWGSTRELLLRLIPRPGHGR
jgi:gentisate 1,2-dioxygenase